MLDAGWVSQQINSACVGLYCVDDFCNTEHSVGDIFSIKGKTRRFAPLESVRYPSFRVAL